MKRKKITIDRAIEMLREEYEQAKNSPVVNNPVAYALYYTWRAVEEKDSRPI